jgi:hypothetical protein
MLAGQCGFGASQSLTVTWNWHVLVLPWPSAAEQVTVVVPFGNVEPEAGEQTADEGGQVHVVVAENVTTLSQRPPVVHVVMSLGQLTVIVHPPLQVLSSCGLLHPGPNVAARRCDCLPPPSLRRARNEPDVLGLQFATQYWIGYVRQAFVGIVTLKR